MFQKLCLVLKISFKQPDGIPPMHSCIEIFLPQSHSGCLDWTWCNDSFATPVSCFNTPVPESLEEQWTLLTEAVATIGAEIFLGFGTKSLADGTSAA
jgi:hypothetical protein